MLLRTFYTISTSKELVNVHANFVCNRINIFFSQIRNLPDNFGVKHAGDTHSCYAPFADCTKMQHCLMKLLNKILHLQHHKNHNTKHRVPASDQLSASLKSWLSHKLLKNFLPAVEVM